MVVSAQIISSVEESIRLQSKEERDAIGKKLLGADGEDSGTSSGAEDNLAPMEEDGDPKLVHRAAAASNGSVGSAVASNGSVTTTAASDSVGNAGEVSSKKEYKVEVVWRNVAKFLVIHALAAAGLLAVPSAHFATLAWGVFTFFISALGVTAGAHRYWTHRSYKAKLPLQIFLAFANAMATENSILVWSRDHRVHHKFSETDADPHNAKRGFFFAHMGWLMCRKHPDVISKGSKIDISDLRNDPVVAFQHRHYLACAFVANLLIPTAVPMYFWGESFWAAYTIAVLRYVVVLHNTWLVNSAAHLWGDKPYDININPAENLVVSLLSTGEGFHNYHHTFPHDYSTSEWRYSFNFTTLFIDAMALIGQAYDRRSVSGTTVDARIRRTGPGTAPKVDLGEKDF